MVQKKMKKHIFLIMILITTPLFSLGYNVNFELDAGITEALFSGQVQENKNFWNDIGKTGYYLNYGGAVIADVIFSENLSVQSGFQYKSLQVNYIISEDRVLGNGLTSLRYQIIQIPVLAKYKIVLKKSTEIIDSLDIAGGLNISCIIGNSSYKDEITTYVGNFISPFIDIGFTAKVTFSHKIGPGNAFIGLKGDINFIPQGYTISGRKMSFGNIATVAPVIGYTFVIKEDKRIAKITEKNKRIKDIDVK